MQGLPDPDLSLPLFGLLWLGLELDLAGGVLGRPRAYDLVKAYYHQAVFLTEGFAGSLVAHLVRVVDERTPAATRPGA